MKKIRWSPGCLSCVGPSALAAVLVAALALTSGMVRAEDSGVLRVLCYNIHVGQANRP